jgi:hypothetical protein
MRDAKPMEIDPWSLYWQNDNLESCIASRSSDSWIMLPQFWTWLPATERFPACCWRAIQASKLSLWIKHK